MHTLQQALDDPQVAAMQVLRASHGLSRLAAPAPASRTCRSKLSVSGGGITHRPPLLGEHTDEVLRGLGYSSAEITELRDARVI